MEIRISGDFSMVIYQEANRHTTPTAVLTLYGYQIDPTQTLMKRLQSGSCL